tara:strand:- start:254 stop:1267 length:1014 start_codon:yes stop_codon:yes gene_type:complete
MREIENIFKKLLNKKDLSILESERLIDLIINQSINSVVISSLLTLLNIKGESFNEIYGAVKILKKRAKKIQLSGDLIDTCGTGGDNKGSFNISTATAILSAACGLKVAKHGNKSVTSKSGSSDVLASLGIDIKLDDKAQKKLFKKNNICFLFAPFYHESLKKVKDIRSSLPFKTIFNLLGPLLNPANLSYQLLGVGNEDNLETHSRCISNLNLKSAWIVHSLKGYDELTTISPNLIIKVKNGKASKRIKVSPQDLGMEYSTENHLKGGTPDENAYIMHRLFEGETGAIRDNVILNTAACLEIAGTVKNLKEGIDLASKNIDNFSAKRKLENLISTFK